MAWKQVLEFDVQRMGSRSGYCLQNCREGFGIPTGKYKSAAADMQAQIAEGTFHTTDLPSNVAVPVYFRVKSPSGHVMVDDHTRFYSDKKYVKSLVGWDILGWGEKCDGRRVVEYVPEPTPPTPTSFLPEKGYWTRGDNDGRVGQLASFMRATFPSYTSPKALGNLYGPYLMASIREFQKRVGIVADGKTGPITYAKLQQYGFKG